MQTAKIIDVRVERTDYGKVRAVSEGYQPMHIVCDDFDQLRLGIHEALTEALAANGRPAQVYAPDVAKDSPVQTWVAVPVAMVAG